MVESENITLTGDQAVQAKNAFLSMLHPWVKGADNEAMSSSFRRARDLPGGFITTGIFSSIEPFENFQGRGDGIIEDVNEGRVLSGEAAHNFYKGMEAFQLHGNAFARLTDGSLYTVTPTVVETAIEMLKLDDKSAVGARNLFNGILENEAKKFEKGLTEVTNNEVLPQQTLELVKEPVKTETNSSEKPILGGIYNNQRTWGEFATMVKYVLGLDDSKGLMNVRGQQQQIEKQSPPPIQLR